MTKHVPFSEAHAALDVLLADVAAGEEVIILREGLPPVRLVLAGEPDRVLGAFAHLGPSPEGVWTADPHDAEFADQPLEDDIAWPDPSAERPAKRHPGAA